VEQIAPSIGSVGDAYDNALMESIIGLYKAECVDTDVFHPGPYKSLGDLEYATAGWVDWYNNRRLHSSLGLRPADQVRTSPPRCPQPGGAANMRAAQKPGRFKRCRVLPDIDRDHSHRHNSCTIDRHNPPPEGVRRTARQRQILEGPDGSLLTPSGNVWEED
jgi:hypothetical protein